MGWKGGPWIGSGRARPGGLSTGRIGIRSDRIRLASDRVGGWAGRVGWMVGRMIGWTENDQVYIWLFRKDQGEFRPGSLSRFK